MLGPICLDPRFRFRAILDVNRRWHFAVAMEHLDIKAAAYAVLANLIGNASGRLLGFPSLDYGDDVADFPKASRHASGLVIFFACPGHKSASLNLSLSQLPNPLDFGFVRDFVAKGHDRHLVAWNSDIPDLLLSIHGCYQEGVASRQRTCGGILRHARNMPRKAGACYPGLTD
jgi:hypothetical protein